MEIENLNAMTDGMVMIKVIALTTILLACAGFAIYLTGIAWLCFQETRQRKPAPRKTLRGSPSNPGRSAPRVADTRLHTTFGNKPRADVRVIVSRSGPLLGASSAPPA